MKSVTITTDGACIGNPGPGGWACVLRSGGVTGEMYGCEPHTTNNRMELTAVIRALETLTEPCAVTLNTDSEYVQKGITQWLRGWKAHDWTRKEGSRRVPIANRELWQELDNLIGTHEIAWKWVRGHASHADNIRCDRLAYKAAREQISSGGMHHLKPRKSAN
jgi:ribonuclease HI